MRLTRGMKKALSLVLSAAMVVTGANVGISGVKAADGDGESTVKLSIVDVEETYNGDGEYSKDITGNLSGQYSGNMGYVYSSEDFTLSNVKVTVNDEYVFEQNPETKEEVLKTQEVVDQEIEDSQSKPNSWDRKKWPDNYPKESLFGYAATVYHADLPNIYNYEDRTVMAVNNDSTAEIRSDKTNSYAKLYVGGTETAITKAVLSFTYTAKVEASASPSASAESEESSEPSAEAAAPEVSPSVDPENSPAVTGCYSSSNERNVSCLHVSGFFYI